MSTARKEKDRKTKKKKCRKPLFSCEEFKLLKVIGEEIVQVVDETIDELDFPVAEVLDVEFELNNVTDHAFKDKVVKQGTICKRVVYCDTSGVVRCNFFEIPFEAVAEIPGVDPKLELEFQNKLVNAETDFEKINDQTILQKVVFDIKIKVSHFVQRKLKVCNTNVISHKQIR